MEKSGTHRTRSSRITEEPRFGQFLPGHTPPLMGVIEATNRCNMNCPVCFSDTSELASDVPLDEVYRRLKQLLMITGTPIPLQISGGEPTVCRHLKKIVAMARSLGYRNIELITNGIKMNQDPAMLPELKYNGLTAIYLQFDGLNKETYLRIRGEDMTEVRHKAVEAARRAGLCCTLAVTVVRGVNDHEVGNIVRFGMDNIDTVRAISLQAATRFTGRFLLDEPQKGYTLPELVQLIASHTGLPSYTFLSDHIGHPLCNAMCPVFVVGGKWEPLFKYIGREDVLEFLGDEGREKILGLFAGKRSFSLRYLSNSAAWKLLAKATPIFGNNPVNVLSSKHILLFAKSFMERDAMDQERIKRCCYGITGAKGVFSFCAFNNLYRFSGDTVP
jgi:uncharacterized radical SAM superfamily Fe-S cluster-containing enzyme